MFIIVKPTACDSAERTLIQTSKIQRIESDEKGHLKIVFGLGDFMYIKGWVDDSGYIVYEKEPSL